MRACRGPMRGSPTYDPHRRDRGGSRSRSASRSRSFSRSRSRSPYGRRSDRPRARYITHFSSKHAEVDRRSSHHSSARRERDRSPPSRRYCPSCTVPLGLHRFRGHIFVSACVGRPFTSNLPFSSWTCLFRRRKVFHFISILVVSFLPKRKKWRQKVENLKVLVARPVKLSFIFKEN